MVSIIKQFVTFEQACDLVDFGFKEDCLSIFSEGRLMCAEDPYCLGVYPYEQNKDKDDELIAPTYQQAFEFIYYKFGALVGADFTRQSQALTEKLKLFKSL